MYCAHLLYAVKILKSSITILRKVTSYTFHHLYKAFKELYIPQGKLSKSITLVNSHSCSKLVS